MLNAAALQQMSEKKEEKENKKMINVDEESTENVKMKKIIKEKFSKKENLDTIMFEVVDVKDPNAVIFMKYHINDTTTISNSFTKKKSSKKDENESFEETKKKKTDE